MRPPARPGCRAVATALRAAERRPHTAAILATLTSPISVYWRWLLRTDPASSLEIRSKKVAEEGHFDGQYGCFNGSLVHPLLSLLDRRLRGDASVQDDACFLWSLHNLGRIHRSSPLCPALDGCWKRRDSSLWTWISGQAFPRSDYLHGHSRCCLRDCPPRLLHDMHHLLPGGPLLHQPHLLVDARPALEASGGREEEEVNELLDLLRATPWTLDSSFWFEPNLYDD